MIPSADGQTAKPALRAAALARRDALGRPERAAASEAIATRAIAILTAAGPSVVAAYRAIRSEVDPAAIADWALGQRIAVALPAVSGGDSLVFRTYRPGEPLTDAGFGTVAPGSQVPEVDPDVIVVPLAAFDRAGHRLGYGRGFYDRGVARLRERGLAPLTLGLAFAVQEVDAIAREPHDVRLDFVVTENETIDFRVTVSEA